MLIHGASVTKISQPRTIVPDASEKRKYRLSGILETLDGRTDAGLTKQKRGQSQNRMGRHCRAAIIAASSSGSQPFASRSFVAQQEKIGGRYAADLFLRLLASLFGSVAFAHEAAIIALFRVVNRYVGNLAPMPGVFPDYPASQSAMQVGQVQE